MALNRKINVLLHEIMDRMYEDIELFSLDHKKVLLEGTANILATLDEVEVYLQETDTNCKSCFHLHLKHLFVKLFDQMTLFKVDLMVAQHDGHLAAIKKFTSMSNSSNS